MREKPFLEELGDLSMRVKGVVEDVVQIGEHLLSVKKQLTPEQYGAWIEQELKLESWKATRYIQIAHQRAEGVDWRDLVEMAFSLTEQGPEGGSDE